MPITTFTARLRGAEVRVASAAGIEDAGQVPAPAALCAELIRPGPAEQALLLGCGHGALGVALARLLPAGHLRMHDPSLLALRLAGETLRLNAVGNAEPLAALSQLPALAGQLDRVVILAPQSRALARRWLAEAHGLLRPGGALTIAGANRGGVRPLIDDAADLFGAATTVGLGQGCRVAEAIRRADPPQQPAWAGAAGIAPGTWSTLLAQLPSGPHELVSLPGIFSYDRLDAGTAFLLAHLELPRGGRTLDIGCGYGPIGVAAALAGASHVDMLDVNLLAVAAAGRNIERYGLRAAALAGDGLAALAGQTYDLLVSNPPFHAGRQIDTAMAESFIAQGRAMIAPGGRMVLVANRFLAYDRTLARHFGRVERIADSPAYHLLAAWD
jgi:16S rRNA (guanine1207-N2)-methyltransferase